MSKERSIRFETYKAYEIQAVPDHLLDTDEWKVSIRILHDRGDKNHFRHFSAGNSFKRWDEAVAHCFSFGKQVIDGKIENCTVDRL